MSLIWPEFLPEVDGERRFAGSRVTPWDLLHAYKTLGYSPEMLALEFPSVSLPVIHRFLAFYLENASELDVLGAAEEAETERRSAATPDHVTLAELRKRLAASRPLSA